MGTFQTSDAAAKFIVEKAYNQVCTALGATVTDLSEKCRPISIVICNIGPTKLTCLKKQFDSGVSRSNWGAQIPGTEPGKTSKPIVMTAANKDGSFMAGVSG